MILAQISDAAAGSAADVLKAQAAQAAAPELYLVLLFAGVIIVVSVYLMLRYAKGAHQTFVDYVRDKDKSEDARMATLQQMNEANNARSDKHLETVVAIATRCEATLRDIDRWRDKSIV